MTVSVHSELYCFSTFTIWWILRVFVHRKSVPCTLHFKEFCFVTNKLITLFLSPGFPCSRLNLLIIRQGLIILVVISKAWIGNIFYFTRKTFTFGQGPATYHSTGIRQGLCFSQWSLAGTRFRFNRPILLSLGVLCLHLDSTISHTNIVNYYSRQIISSETRFSRYPQETSRVWLFKSLWPILVTIYIVHFLIGFHPVILKLSRGHALSRSYNLYQ